jgi:hypothetical protein
MPSTPESEDWAVEEFGAAELSDARRTHRLIALARRLAQSPQCSFPNALNDADLKAAYPHRFFRHPVQEQSKRIRHQFPQHRIHRRRGSGQPGHEQGGGQGARMGLWANCRHGRLVSEYQRQGTNPLKDIGQITQKKYPSSSDKLGNQYDMVGSEIRGESKESWSGVANSQLHYGTDVQIFIENQPFTRGDAGNDSLWKLAA